MQGLLQTRRAWRTCKNSLFVWSRLLRTLRTGDDLGEIRLHRLLVRSFGLWAGLVHRQHGIRARLQFRLKLHQGPESRLRA